jgi:hypothetical protein
MILHVGERVYWGTPEVIYLEGTITALDEKNQSVVVRIERTTAHSAHLIGSDLSFATNGIKLLIGESPPGVTSERSAERKALPPMSDDEKVRRAAAAAVHQQYGYQLPDSQEHTLIEQITQTINHDPAIREQIINSMNEILRREH